MASIVPTANKLSITEKKAILDTAASDINKKAQKVICGRISKTPEIEEKLRIKWIPTPSYKLNKATGGGFPIGKFTIITGDEDSGKTSLCLETIGYNMKKNPDFFAVWVESENSLSLDYIINTFHIDPERFFFIKHENDGGAEAALDILCSAVDSGIFNVAVINSLKCLVPKTELENNLQSNTIALQARLNSKMTKKFTAMIQEHDTAFIAITHKTTDITVTNKYMDKMVISGGRAIRYAALLILDSGKLSVAENDPISKEEGAKFKVRIKKNHCICDAYPYVSVEYLIRYGQGIAWDFELLDAAIEKGILKNAGAWISEIDENGDEVITENGEKRKWQGKVKFSQYLHQNEDYKIYLEQRVAGNFSVDHLSEEDIETFLEEERDDKIAEKELEKVARKNARSKKNKEIKD